MPTDAVPCLALPCLTLLILSKLRQLMRKLFSVGTRIPSTFYLFNLRVKRKLSCNRSLPRFCAICFLGTGVVASRNFQFPVFPSRSSESNLFLLLLPCCCSLKSFHAYYSATALLLSSCISFCLVPFLASLVLLFSVEALFGSFANNTKASTNLPRSYTLDGFSIE